MNIRAFFHDKIGGPILGPCLFGLLLMLAGTAQAQTQRSGSDATRVVQQLQQTTIEKDRLQQDNDALSKELEALKAKYTQAGTEQSRLQQRVRELETADGRQQASGRDNEAALQQSRAQLQELITKFRETAQTLRDVETERDALSAGKTAQERELKTCVDKNAQMYLLSDEVLQQFGSQGFWSAMKHKEPFTQLSRTRLENLAEEYRYRIDELKLSGKTSAVSP